MADYPYDRCEVQKYRTIRVIGPIKKRDAVLAHIRGMGYIVRFPYANLLNETETAIDESQFCIVGHKFEVNTKQTLSVEDVNQEEVDRIINRTDEV